MRGETFMCFERIGNAAQGLAQMFGQHRLIGQIVRHLAQPVHIVAETDEPGRRAAGQRLERATHESGAQNLLKGADMRQAGWAVAGFKQNRVAIGFRAIGIAFVQPLRLDEWPGLGVAGGGLKIGIAHTLRLLPMAPYVASAKRGKM